LTLNAFIISTTVFIRQKRTLKLAKHTIAGHLRHQTFPLYCAVAALK